MSRPIRVLLVSSASVAAAAFSMACGTQRISIAKSDPTYGGAVLFSQRCSGCHTLSFAATRGSAANVRTREITNGPNFNVRCERPISRVLYAIENGGFSGAIMPQNVVVGQDAIKVARFVAQYAGRQTSVQAGTTSCANEPIGSIPPPTATTATSASATTATTATRSGASASKRHAGKTAGGQAKKKTARR